MHKFKESKVFMVDYEKIEDIIKKEYNHPEYSFVADIEGNNYSSYVYENVGNNTLDKFEIADLRKFQDFGKYTYIIHVLLEDLAQNEIIPKGTYVISVYW